MKKIKALSLISAVIIIAIAFSGCQLKKEAPESAAGDRLIGAFVTTDYLDTFDVESYLKDNINEITDGGEVEIENTIGYEKKIYAEKVKIEDEGVFHEEYIFDLEGFWLYDVTIPKTEDSEKYTSLCSEGINNINVATHQKDDGEELTLEGAIYYTKNKTFYLNPVFQEKDGDVYTVAGQGLSSSGGGISSSTLSDEITITEGEEKKTYKTTVKMSYIIAEEPKEVTFVFMKGAEALSEFTYKPQEVPEKLKAPKGAEYLLVLEKGNSTVPEAYGNEEETAEYLKKSSDGFCSKAAVNIDW